MRYDAFTDGSSTLKQHEQADRFRKAHPGQHPIVFIPELIFLLLLLSLALIAQNNCSNPLPVNICPSTYLPAQTNAGMGDDNPTACNIYGNDIVYRINAPNGADHIYISIINASDTMTVSLLSGNCSSGTCLSSGVLPGLSNLVFNVSSVSTYYLWIDAKDTTTFDISIGGDTGITTTTVPDTQGDLRFDSSACSTPGFSPSKKYFQVTYNGIYQTDPMTLSPLNVAGTMCIRIFLRNTSGVEGPRIFAFTFNPVGLHNVSAVTTIPGFYNAGNYSLSQSGDTYTYTFNDSLNTGRGDFTGTPNSCLAYTFCFGLIPVSNSPALTNVDFTITTDGWGFGYTSFAHQGCCPALISNCLAAGMSSGGNGVNGMSSGFADPGSPLPVQLISFTAKAEDRQVNLQWTTASEFNNDRFELEKSTDALHYETIGTVAGNGTTTLLHSYQFTDYRPVPGYSYYRLKQIDFNGNATNQGIVSVLFNDGVPCHFYELSENVFLMSCSQVKGGKISVFDTRGSLVIDIGMVQRDILIDLRSFPSGLYFVRVDAGEEQRTIKLFKSD